LFARRRSGLGLGGILIIGAVLYYSGAGTWLWNRIQSLGGSCYALIQETNFHEASPVCDGLSKGLARLSSGTGDIMQRLRMGVGQNTDRLVGDMGSFSQALFNSIAPGNNFLSSMASPSEQLQKMMRQSPAYASISASTGGRLQAALDQFVIGQHFLQNDQASQAMPWLQESAQQPGGYGVLSQLSLGDLYKSGNYGIGQDNAAARSYYQQALQSVNMLQQDGSVQSQQLLNSVTTNPDVLRRQLEAQIQRLR